MARYLQLAIAGLTSGSIYALIGIGFNVVFAANGILNLAHGEFFMFGSMFGALFLVSFGWPLAPALLATIVLTGAVGALEERFAVRPIKGRRGAFGWILSTLGFAIVMRSVIAIAMGPDIRRVPDLIDVEPIRFAGAILTVQRLTVFMLAIVVTFALHRFYRRSLTGQAMTAVSADPEAAALRGLPVQRFAAWSFVVAAVVAGLAGFVAAPITTASASVGLVITLKGFIASAVGGITDVRGALVGGLGLGLIESFGADLLGGGYREPVVFFVLIVALTLRPAGLLGRASVREV